MHRMLLIMCLWPCAMMHMVAGRYIEYDLCGTKGRASRYSVNATDLTAPGYNQVPYAGPANSFHGYNTRWAQGVEAIGDLNGDGFQDMAVIGVGLFASANTHQPDHREVDIIYFNGDMDVLEYKRVIGIGNFSDNGITVNNYNFGMVMQVASQDFDGTPGIDLWVSGREAIYILYINPQGECTGYDIVEMAPDTNLTNWFIVPWGAGMAEVGDMDGDGIVDLVVGFGGDASTGSVNNVNKPHEYYGDGSVYLFLLQTTSTHSSDVYGGTGQNIVKSYMKFDRSHPVLAPVISRGSNFGFSVGNVGDFNGDGIMEIAVGQYSTYDTGNRGSFVFMTFDATASLVNASRWDPSDNNYLDFAIWGSSMFGRTRIVSVGDFDGDGVSELFTANTEIDAGGWNAGSCFLFYMTTEFTVKRAVLYANMLPFPEMNNDKFGRALTVFPGDIYNDGLVDVAIVYDQDCWRNTDGCRVLDNDGELLGWQYGEGSVLVMSLHPCFCQGNRTGTYCEQTCANGGVGMWNTTGRSQAECLCPGTGFSGSDCTKECLNGGVTLDEFPYRSCDCSMTNAWGSTCSKDCGIHTVNHTAQECTCLPGSGLEGKNCNNDIDDCLSSPCLNMGTCTDDGSVQNNFNCSCTGLGFSGRLCEIPDCASSPCMNDGVCDGVFEETFVIDCNCSHTGYEGLFCETEIDECASAPCMNNGACIDLLLNFSCNCQDTGYVGPLCSTDIDDCLSSPCVHGVCTDKGANKFKCLCEDTGYEGTLCENDIDDCILRGYECQNQAPCADDPDNHGGVLCDCSQADGGFTGQYCDLPVESACASFNPCAHGGRCSVNDLTRVLECDCSNTGYEGLYCEEYIFSSDCVSAPCQNGGTCIHENVYQPKYYCICADGYFGDICSSDVCESDPCEADETCSFSGNEILCSSCDDVVGCDDDAVGADLESSSSSMDTAGAGGEEETLPTDVNNSDNMIAIIAIIAGTVFIIALMTYYFVFRKPASSKDRIYNMPT